MIIIERRSVSAVAPSSDDGVHSPDHTLVEERGGPCLTRDKGSAEDACTMNYMSTLPVDA